MKYNIGDKVEVSERRMKVFGSISKASGVISETDVSSIYGVDPLDHSTLYEVEFIDGKKAIYYEKDIKINQQWYREKRLKQLLKG